MKDCHDPLNIKHEFSCFCFVFVFVIVVVVLWVLCVCVCVCGGGGVYFHCQIHVNFTEIFYLDMYCFANKTSLASPGLNGDGA